MIQILNTGLTKNSSNIIQVSHKYFQTKHVNNETFELIHYQHLTNFLNLLSTFLPPTIHHLSYDKQINEPWNVERKNLENDWSCFLD